MINHDDMTRRFLLYEGEMQESGVFSRIQAIQDLLSKISPKSQMDVRRIEMIDDNLRALRRIVRALTSKDSQEADISGE